MVATREVFLKCADGKKRPYGCHLLSLKFAKLLFSLLFEGGLGRTALHSIDVHGMTAFKQFNLALIAPIHPKQWDPFEEAFVNEATSVQACLGSRSDQDIQQTLMEMRGCKL